MEHFDVIVIGAGAMGSAATYYLTKAGKKVLLIEQFEFLHNQGSSHGESRIIRRTYPAKHFANLMSSTYELWHEIEKEIDETIIQKTGGLDFGPKDNSELNSVENACKSIGVNYEKLDVDQLRNRFPMLNIPNDYFGIYQTDAGIINATRSVSIIQNLAKKHGAKLVDNSKVEAINTNDTDIEVVTNQSKWTAEKIVITSGAWINSILGLIKPNIQIDVEIWKMTIAYWKVLNPVLYSPPNFPIFINWGEKHFYGFPLSERREYIKIAPHFKSETIDNVETKNIEPIHDVTDLLINYVNSRFYNIDATPVDLQSCLYTMTSDENFIIDFHPNNSKIVIGAGFSGHGFKFTPLIGKMIAQMISDGKTEYDRSEFLINSKIKDY